MKLPLITLDPHFLKRVSAVAFDHTDDMSEAEGLQLQCPACYLAERRIGAGKVAHVILLWRDPEHWQFAGSGYHDLSLMAGRLMVSLTAGICQACFHIKDGKVEFY